MKAVIALTALSAASAAITPDMHKRPALDDAVIKAVNSGKTTWTAARNSRFEGATMAQAAKLTGAWLKAHPNHDKSLEPEVIDFRLTGKGTGGKGNKKPAPADALPEDFDVRTKWPQCQPVMNYIRDQSDCGDCYAFGTTSAFNDRWCIATKELVQLGAEDTATCYKGFNSSGCDGGSPYGVYMWFRDEGVVTGGDHSQLGKGLTCKPYELPTCGHHTFNDPTIVRCPASEYVLGGCNKTCDAGYATPYAQDKRKAKLVYGLPNDEAAIRAEIFAHGSVTAGMTVYEDFFAYSTGVYQNTTAQVAGGHSVRIMGWGVDKETNTPYWLVANSWGPSWADNGFFKIIRGVNNCGIEEEVLAAQA